MYLTQTDLINLKIKKGRKLSDSEILKNIINSDLLSLEKKKADEGERYYKCDHDIKRKDFRKSFIVENKSDLEDKEEDSIKEFVNPNRSNHHNVNTFHKILVEQKVAYIFGKEPTITIKGSEKNKDLKTYEDLLTDFTDEQFSEVFQDCITGASNCGFCAVHVYYDDDNTFKYCMIPAKELILIYDSEYQQNLLEVIRYYNIEVIDNGYKYLRKRVEWWTSQDVKYFIQDNNDNFVLDTSMSQNPKPHWQDIISINDIQVRHEEHSWGRVPFIILKNNSSCTTDLEPIKDLIDAYDLISSEGTNNFLDLVDLYWVITGYAGDSANAFVRKLQINKAVNLLNANEAGIEAKQVDLPVDGRKLWLDIIRRDIYHFGQGVDIDTSKFGTAPSGVSLKFQYSNLDLKANSVIVRLKKALKDFFWFYTEYLNKNNGTNYDSSLIKVDINKSQIMNDLETVQIIQSLVGIVSSKTLLSMNPFVSDVNEELKLLEQENSNAVDDYLKKVEDGDSSE